MTYNCKLCQYEATGGDTIRVGANGWRCPKCGTWQETRAEIKELGVKNPKSKHYELWDEFQVIDAIKALLTPEEFNGFLKGNMLKYRLRAGKKGSAADDIEKANDYERGIKNGKI